MDSLVNVVRQPLKLAIISALIVLIAVVLNTTLLYPFTLVSTILGTPSAYVKDAKTGISYRGTSANGVETFQNIFYAEDTSGLNRFAPPVPYMPLPGSVVDATKPGAWCPQGVGGPPLPWTSPVTNVSENCLSLKIARPSGVSATTKLPVLVWIHGGMKIPKIIDFSSPLIVRSRWRCARQCIRSILPTKWFNTAGNLKWPASNLRRH